MCPKGTEGDRSRTALQATLTNYSLTSKSRETPDMFRIRKPGNEECVLERAPHSVKDHRGPSGFEQFCEKATTMGRE